MKVVSLEADKERLRSELTRKDRKMARMSELIRQLEAKNLTLTTELAAAQAENERVCTALSDALNGDCPTPEDVVKDLSSGLCLDDSEDDGDDNSIAPGASIACRHHDSTSHTLMSIAAHTAPPTKNPQIEGDARSCRSEASESESDDNTTQRGHTLQLPKINRSTCCHPNHTSRKSTEEKPQWLRILASKTDDLVSPEGPTNLPHTLRLSVTHMEVEPFMQQDVFMNSRIRLVPSGELICMAGSKTLDLSNHHLDLRSAHILSRALSINTAFETVNLSNNDLCDDSIRFLVRALAVNKRISKVDVSNNSFGPAGVAAFCELLSMQTSSLDCDDVATLQEPTKCGNGLQSLNLSNNQLGPQAAIAIASALKHNRRPVLCHLDLSTTNVGIEGSKALALMLMRNKSLEDLVLSGPRNNVGVAGCVAICAGLAQNDHLKRLWLARNNIANEGVMAFVQTVLANNTTIQELDISWDLVGDKAGRILLDEMTRCAQAGVLNLSRVNMYGNKFSLSFLNELKRETQGTTLSDIFVFDPSCQPLAEEKSADCIMQNWKTKGAQAERSSGQRKPNVLKSAEMVGRIVDRLRSGHNVEHIDRTTMRMPNDFKKQGVAMEKLIKKHQ